MTLDAYSTPPKIAALYTVKPAKVLKWIETGELVAINLAESPNGRPRWRVSPEALADFERRRSSRPPIPRAKKRRLPEVPKYV
ncbi:MAG: helix-turn-helix domain-containing protein [Pirellulaceae bacterium]